MPDHIKNRFSLSYERGALASCLLVEVTSPEKVLKYQVEMIKHNDIRHLLPLDMRVMNDDVRFYYDITSLMTLSQFLKRKRISWGACARMLSELASAILDGKNFLLSENSFLMDVDCIYINPLTLEVHMVYIPVMLEGNAGERFRNFAAELITHLADMDDEGTGIFLQKTLGFIKSETFNISGFRRLLLELQSGFPGEGDDEEASSIENGMQYQTPVKADMKIENIKPEEENTVPGTASRSHLIIAVISQVLIAALIILGSDFLKSLSEDVTTTYGAVALVVAALDVLLFRSLFRRRDIVITLEKKPPKAQNTDAQVQNDSGSTASGWEGIVFGISKKEGEITDGRGEVQAAPGGKQNNSDTMILSQAKGDVPVLRGTGADTCEEIAVTKPDFIIGRLKDQVDYVSSNSAIGKVHAQIVAKNGSYYIKDLNSRNGTYINDTRVDSNKEYEIRNGDRVTLANTDYVFIAP